MEVVFPGAGGPEEELTAASDCNKTRGTDRIGKSLCNSLEIILFKERTAHLLDLAQDLLVLELGPVGGGDMEDWAGKQIRSADQSLESSGRNYKS